MVSGAESGEPVLNTFLVGIYLCSRGVWSGFGALIWLGPGWGSYCNVFGHSPEVYGTKWRKFRDGPVREQEWLWLTSI